MDILKTTQLTKIYGSGDTAVHALENVNLTVEKGEFAAVVGTSGSGKSTLLHMIGGLDVPTSGRVFVDGQELGAMTDEQLTIFRRRNIGFVFQMYNLIPMLNVWENIILPVKLDGKTPDRDYLQKIVEILGLDQKLSCLPNALSGGQQQRVAIARAIAANPEIVLADEPTGNLDSASGQEILSILTSLNQEGKTIILITHDPAIASKTNRKIKIKNGRVSADRKQKHESLPS